jgi:hypothetical protein
VAAGSGAVEFMLRDSHGVIQVPMDCEGIHLHDFHPRAAFHGSPDMTLATLRFREGVRLTMSMT